MGHEMDAMKYFMAAERVQGLMIAIDYLMDFVEEFKVSPDEEVKKALQPEIDKIKEWIK